MLDSKWVLMQADCCSKGLLQQRGLLHQTGCKPVRTLIVFKLGNKDCNMCKAVGAHGVHMVFMGCSDECCGCPDGCSWVCRWVDMGVMWVFKAWF